MTDFFVDGEFYSDLDELMEACGVYAPVDLLDDEEGLGVLEDDWSVVAYEAYSAPIIQISADDIIEQVLNVCNFPDDDNDQTYDRVVEALKAGIDVTKINSLMPSVWRPTKEKFIITKQDLINYIA